MELHFTKTNGPADEAIDRLIELVGDIHHPEIVREMILASLKAGQENDERADLKLMNSTLKEMRFTAKVFGPYHKVRKVSVFGSARTQSDESIYEMACHLGQKLAEAGYMVITGGGLASCRRSMKGLALSTLSALVYGFLLNKSLTLSSKGTPETSCINTSSPEKLPF